MGLPRGVMPSPGGMASNNLTPILGQFSTRCVIAGGCSPQATRSDSLGLSKAANRRATVKQYVGLDVSQKETAVCVMRAEVPDPVVQQVAA